MIKFCLILLGIVFVACMFIPDKYLPKDKPRKSSFKNWHPDDTGGLRWMGNKKRQRKNEKFFWDD